MATSYNDAPSPLHDDLLGGDLGSSLSLEISIQVMSIANRLKRVYAKGAEKFEDFVPPTDRMITSFFQLKTFIEVSTGTRNCALCISSVLKTTFLVREKKYNRDMTDVDEIFLAAWRYMWEIDRIRIPGPPGHGNN